MLTRDEDFLSRVRYIELQTKLHEMKITPTELHEFMKLVSEKKERKKQIINREIQHSSEKIQDVLDNYKIELSELEKACSKFDEEVISFGDVVIYLPFERFVHIYARHVAETQIGAKFESEKTVFQYKYEDILRILKMVVNQERNNIQNHFKQNSDSPFRRLGSRAIYTDGTYYRLVINSNGSIQDFHPYNNNEEREKDDSENSK